ncbi:MULTISPECIES: DUF1465 family protein [unclassified Sphingomonas]|uniref:DUF1465 family protein n=1 Tax=unclassified Sphingomonas TaxID=196159 RepID=UPI0007022DFC|nr:MULTISPECIES: DUF1465 family protein [unclassified Sphingomonas]KQM27210.1 hypothetical protein ASE58_09600 [Sphingomonas sp. Leaf9]KQM43547.1 hypothetical protein ASE57_09605 [Sphingomonas sp. Leaf11]KQM88522.1 hypothetical protein ASE67_01870 [Sphingomonas sp. Leaf23]
MEATGTGTVVHRRLIDSLYVEAMLLADEARSYFNDAGQGDRALLDPMARVVLSCESLKITTRLMHVIAWLLTQRAIDAGEIVPDVDDDPLRALATPPVTEETVLATMPEGTQTLIRASINLYRRAERIERSKASPPPASPARAMFERLAMQL